MRTIHLSEGDSTQIESLSPSVLAVGFFDGIHKGHQRVISTAIKKAQELDVESAVMTFDPHPSVVLNNSIQHARYITPLPEKKQILKRMGVHTLYVVHFDQALASLSPENFVEKFFIDLKVLHVVAGFDFSFGFKGKGSMELLPIYAEGRFTTTTIPQVTQEENKVSSTRIRRLLDQGDVSGVENLLSRPFSLNGKVVSGEQRGRTIGYPTANILLNGAYYTPADGVYAVKVECNNELLEGMANFGVKPTFDENSQQSNLEVHIFDFDHDLYDEMITVYFYQLIRHEIKFDGAEQLKVQLHQDEKRSREVLATI
ncbi:bifunctional riboflavin kinase/FAD synthetase [Halobacillus seohaensis]|uniref:Riboflavin biosynthesis protein n=1 Tax=Halobacillus seohaensis TaxID=447421 RepID=A0ABW2EJJ4_9BACI